jgi:hypothetical protein
MQGLPINHLQKSASNSAKGIAANSSKAAPALKDGKGAVSEKETNGEFASLFADMSAKAEGENSQVETKPGELLKNLLSEKNDQSKKTASSVLASADGQIAIDPKLLNTKAKTEESNPALHSKGQSRVEDAVAQLSSNLDKLLNTLKGTQGNAPVEGAEEDLELLPHHHKNVNPSKGNVLQGSPLDFLVKGVKEKGLSENTSAEGPGTEVAAGLKQVMTGEDFIKMQSAEKKNALSLINGQKGEEQTAAKMMGQSAKSYGQGMNLMSDSLIKNTKDFANKDVKKGKQNIMGIDELHTKETKAGAELASLRQDAIPGLQNTKENHGQSQLQTSANQKVLDLSQLNSSNTNEIIKKISDYVEQSNVANKQSLDLTVKHDSLGEFKIQVSKIPDSMNGGLNQLDMQITTSSKEGHDFFVKNEVSLMKNLNQAGINLSDLRIVSSSSESNLFGQSDSRQSNSFSQNSDGSKQYMSFESSSSSSDNGSERRKELWEEYQQRYGA